MSNTQLVDEDFLQEALKITEQARHVGVPLRAMGACAVRIHCSNHLKLHKVAMQRRITDLDFVTLRRYQTDVRDIVKQYGYSPDLAMVGIGRDIYRNTAKSIVMDVFFDRLEMCHTIEFGSRLEIDFPTISLADLILEKLQVVKINEKDVKDVIVLLLEHEVGQGNRETIDTEYIAKLLAGDWGFYYTVTTNLDKLRNMAANQYGNMLLREDIETINSRVDGMLSRFDEEPKSMKWKMRERVGTKRIWYKEVEEVAMGSLTEYLMKRSQTRGA
jgi:hypothetical protein